MTDTPQTDDERELALAISREEGERVDRRPGYDVGAGTVKEGDDAVYESKPCKVLTIYQDGDVQIEAPAYVTTKWRFVTPASGGPSPGAATGGRPVVRGPARGNVPVAPPDATKCTCHPYDNPPVPCPRRFAYSECKAFGDYAAAREAVRTREIVAAIRGLTQQLSHEALEQIADAIERKFRGPGNNVDVKLRDPNETISGELLQQTTDGIWLYGWATVHFFPQHRIVEIVDRGRTYR